MLKDLEESTLYHEDYDRGLKHIAKIIPGMEVKDVFEYNDYSLGVMVHEKEYTGKERPFATVLLPFDFLEIIQKYKKEKPEPLESLKLVSLKDAVIHFNDNEPALIIGNKKCQLPPYKNEHFLCRVMFQYSKNEAVDWSTVFAKMNSIDSLKDGRDFKKDMRSVQDTLYAVNDRLKEVIHTDDSLFSWENKCVIRKF